LLDCSRRTVARYLGASKGAGIVTRVYRPALNWDDDMRTHDPSMSVIDVEPLNQFSSLLDLSGNKLMVTTIKEPVSFVVFKESK
jgi:hypothetical protein